MKRLTTFSAMLLLLSSLAFAQCDPEPKFGSKTNSDKTIKLAELLDIRQLDAFVRNADCPENSWVVSAFEVTVLNADKVPITHSATSALLTSAQQKLIEDLMVGQKVYFEGIVASNNEGLEQKMGTLVFFIE